MPNLLVVYSLSGTDANQHYQSEVNFKYVDIKKGGTRSFQLLSAVAEADETKISWDKVVIRASIDLSTK